MPRRDRPVDEPDNGLIVAPLADAAELACINYTGGERTRGRYGFHYQVGSLEEEPVLLAQRLAARGLRRPAVIFDRSPVGRRYAEYFEASTAGAGLELTGATSVSPIAQDVTPVVERLRALEADGARLPRPRRDVTPGGAGARRPGLGRARGRQLGAAVRVRPPRLAGRLGRLGVRRRDRRRQPAAPGPGRAGAALAAGPMGCSRPSTWAGCSARRWPASTTSTRAGLRDAFDTWSSGSPPPAGTKAPPSRSATTTMGRCTATTSCCAPGSRAGASRSPTDPPSACSIPFAASTRARPASEASHPRGSLPGSSGRPGRPELHWCHSREEGPWTSLASCPPTTRRPAWCAGSRASRFRRAEDGPLSAACGWPVDDHPAEETSVRAEAGRLNAQAPGTRRGPPLRSVRAALTADHVVVEVRRTCGTRAASALASRACRRVRRPRWRAGTPPGPGWPPAPP